MNEPETIQAAIDKLMDQASAADHGPYYADDHVGHDGQVVMGQEGRIAHIPGDVHTGAETADLIVTLHATIDAQVKVLEVGLRFVRLAPGLFTEAALDLANAILGGQVSE